MIKKKRSLKVKAKNNMKQMPYMKSSKEEDRDNGSIIEYLLYEKLWKRTSQTEIEVHVQTPYIDQVSCF